VVTETPVGAYERSCARNGVVLAIVDAGPLYAVVDDSDDDHQRSLQTLQRRDLQLVIPTMIVAEVSYLIGARLGPDKEAIFLAGLAEFEVEAPLSSDWPRIAELVKQYRDFPLGGADASVVALAERLDTDILITLDHRHFRSIRPRHRRAFHLLPENL
jgi:predicted nucleic acid-binding protein